MSSSKPRSNSQDAIDAKEMTPIPSSEEPSKGKNKIDAFAALMAPKQKEKTPSKRATSPSSSPLKKARAFGPRDALGNYLENPSSFPPSRVIRYNEKFVTINDLYPKASIHLLVLPRDSTKNLLHPFEAFEDAEFLKDVREEVEIVKGFAAKELKRRYGKGENPEGKDWGKELKVGIHAHPSMSHLHVHVISADNVSECLKKKKHYNSFNTPFLVPLEAFPLAKDDPRRHPGRAGYLNADMACWRCGKVEKTIPALKKHLEVEFEEWKKAP
ncbi:aprataxin-like protein [Rhizina undulata]